MTQKERERIVEKGKRIFREEGEAPTKKCAMCEDPKYLPGHNGSRRCRSGSIASGGTRAHCTCNLCF